MKTSFYRGGIVFDYWLNNEKIYDGGDDNNRPR
jgi:hypothetical protein